MSILGRSGTWSGLSAAGVPGRRDYRNAKTPEARKFAAIFAILKNPGLMPEIRSGVGRLTPLDTIDDFRDNWWCSYAPEPEGEEPVEHDFDPYETFAKPVLKPRPPTLVTTAEHDAAETEFARLGSLGTAPNTLCAATLDWAQKNPNDPRVPEALHRAVRTTRFGCTDDDTSSFSKAAFERLHARYPKSEWAAKTKYWF